ncbi:hypothetical protein TNCT_277651 [Trichonephila clavata]|uniref:Kazal-like domain-containing protein n=1 Tax=Trichonephila clavata TaxID=2740835 RepID=A0A8X6EZ34_TRICU|nr:hypothetical protein TNCT_277651 [Trichonephila clavata]
MVMSSPYEAGFSEIRRESVANHWFPGPLVINYFLIKPFVHSTRQNCTTVDAVVCGTDGVTYKNECEMRVAACEKEQYVMVGSRGPCGKES